MHLATAPNVRSHALPVQHVGLYRLVTRFLQLGGRGCNRKVANGNSRPGGGDWASSRWLLGQVHVEMRYLWSVLTCTDWRRTSCRRACARVGARVWYSLRVKTRTRARTAEFRCSHTSAFLALPVA